MDPAIYPAVLDYLDQHHTLFERCGLKHPFTVFYPTEAQSNDLNSILAPQVPRTWTDTSTFAFYDNTLVARKKQAGQRLYNGTTFAFDRLETTPLRLHARLGHYFDMMSTCVAMDYELREAVQHGKPTPMRNALYNRISVERLLTDGRFRSAAVGVSTLIVFRSGDGYEFLLVKRSTKTSHEPNSYHVVPSFAFQPSGPDYDDREWSLEAQVYREFLEELFGIEEIDDEGDAVYDTLYQQAPLQDLRQMIQAGQASLHLTGLNINLLTTHPSIAVLIFIRDPEWIVRNEPRFQASWEAGQHIRLPLEATDEAQLAVMPANFPASFAPNGAASFWLGTELARTLL